MKNGLKPVVFIQGKRKNRQQKDLTQRLLLKAISEGITDPEELKKLAGLKTATDVFRTLDKMAIRKEYHAALIRAGLDLDYITSGIKEICENKVNNKVRLGAFQLLLKSLGLETYTKEEDSGKRWEEALLQAVESVGGDKSLPEQSTEAIEGEVEPNILEMEKEIEKEYEVSFPDIPEEEKKKLEIEKDEGRSMYE